MIASASGDRTIKFYDPLSFKNLGTINFSSSENIITCISFSNYGDKLIAGSTDKSVQLYSAPNGKNIHSFMGHYDKVNGVTFTSHK